MNAPENIDANHFIEGVRAQRTEAADSAARWFALYTASKEREKALEAKVAELVAKLAAVVAPAEKDA